MTTGETPRKPVPTVKLFECPSCGGQVKIRALGQSLSVTCTSCHSLIDVTNENYRILQTYAANTRIQPRIPLGTRGALGGRAFEVVGFLQRQDSGYVWDEYLLYNPYYGFRWLVLADGHWSFVTMTKLRPEEFAAGRRARLNGQVFSRFQIGKAKVTYVLGEFYWRVGVGQAVQTVDYILPPQMLSKETDVDEVVWSIGEYLRPQAVEKAFHLTGLPRPTGVAPNQPGLLGRETGRIARIGLLFALIAVATQCAQNHSAREQVAHSETIVHAPDDNGKVKATERFDLTGDLANVSIRSQANLANQWIGLSMTLTPADAPVGGDVFPVSQELSFYSGYDDGEYWTEGSRSVDTVISAVPGGSYFLNIETQTDPGKTVGPVQLWVMRDVPTYSNLVLALLMIGAIPLMLSFLKARFESQRWANSDFSP